MKKEVEDATIEKCEDKILIEVDGCWIEIIPGRITEDKKKTKTTRILIRAEDLVSHDDGTDTIWNIKPIFGEYEVGSKLEIDLEKRIIR